MPCLLTSHVSPLTGGSPAFAEPADMAFHASLRVLELRAAVRAGPRERVGHPGEHHLLGASRSEEHTSELQSQSNLVCRLLLEKKKKKRKAMCMLLAQCCYHRT